MSHILGIVVNLVMSNAVGGWGTDDQIYIGVHGTGGGREFPLDVEGFDDFEKNTNVTYVLGTVWDGAAISGQGIRHPKRSGDEGFNDPQRASLDLEGVNSVYIRKLGLTTKNDDDACRVNKVTVTLYGANPVFRIFTSINNGAVRHPGLHFGNEYGLQHWLREGDFQ